MHGSVCCMSQTLPCLGTQSSPGGQSAFTLHPSVQELQLVNGRGRKPESSQASGKVRPEEGPGGWREQKQAGFSRLPGWGWVELGIYNQHGQQIPVWLETPAGCGNTAVHHSTRLLVPSFLTRWQSLFTQSSQPYTTGTEHTYFIKRPPRPSGINTITQQSGAAEAPIPASHVSPPAANTPCLLFVSSLKEK